MLGKEAFPPAPVNAQILGQKAGDDHAQAVVHVAGAEELAHGRIHQRVAGMAGTPGGPEVGRLIPAQLVEFWLEGVRDDLRVVPQDHEIEIAPGQFVEPGLSTGAAQLGLGDGQTCGLTDRQGAKAQVDRQVGDTFLARKVTGDVVVRQTRYKILEQALCP